MTTLVGGAHGGLLLVLLVTCSWYLLLGNLLLGYLFLGTFFTGTGIARRCAPEQRRLHARGAQRT